MNKILKLSGQFSSRGNSATVGAPELPRGKSVDAGKIERLINELREILAFWNRQTLGFKPIVSIYYNDVIAKSNRVGILFSSKGIPSNQSIVGAKFTEESNPKHVITHCISVECINNTILNLGKCRDIIVEELHGSIDYNLLKSITDNKTRIKSKTLSKTAFAGIIKDVYHVDRFDLPMRDTAREIKDAQIVSIYDTGLSLEETLRRIHLSNNSFERLDDYTWLLSPTQYSDLYQKAPYLISMSLKDLREIKDDSSTDNPQLIDNRMTIPHPTNEPTIGVIDTLFSSKVYFNEWVEYHEIVDPALITKESYSHGTAVSSLIVDGPSLNPHLEDDCGRFRVRHFGVAIHGKNSSTNIINSIRDIVLSNKDIKVWNLSLGSEMETKFNSISPEAAILDQLQYENDVVFVISGTNNNDFNKSFPRVGAPADSINSIVVNSILYSGKPASYSRSGPVLCFFNKPDVSAYGGDGEDRITVYTDGGIRKTNGTSYAAPWVTRKIAYLMHILKFPREVAKALIIDAACGWNTDTKQQHLIGFGRVPTKISDIIKTPNDEIKFTMYGTVESYDTYAYTIPVPTFKDKFPYIAKATLCYFPKCSRNQGVDYTDTELDIHFGRISDKALIKSIDNNMQGDPGCIVQYEANARKEFRKWDNVKHISEGIKEANRAKKLYTKQITPDKIQVFDTWGISIKTKDRLESKSGKGLHFGVVITLKEINGVNRIGEFIQRCRTGYWFTEEVDAEAMVENYMAEEAEIEFEE